MIGAIRSLKIVSSPSLSQGSQGGRPAFEPNKSLEKNGRAWLLPSYLRTKLGRSLALPMKLQAIGNRRDTAFIRV